MSFVSGVVGVSGAGVGAVTVTLQFAVFAPTFAVIVAVPAFTAVTFPLLSTFAIAVLLEVQVTVLLSVVSVGL